MKQSHDRAANIIVRSAFLWPQDEQPLQNLNTVWLKLAQLTPNTEVWRQDHKHLQKLMSYNIQWLMNIGKTLTKQKKIQQKHQTAMICSLDQWNNCSPRTDQCQQACWKPQKTQSN